MSWFVSTSFGHTDFRRGKRLGKRDHVVSWQRPQRPPWMEPATYAAMPGHITLREVRVGDWTLVSSLVDAKTVSKRDLNELYCWRWHVEVDLHSIKIGMQMDVLRCQGPDTVGKEIAAHLLVHNVVCVVLAQARSSQPVASAPIELHGRDANASCLCGFPESQPAPATCASLCQYGSPHREIETLPSPRTSRAPRQKATAHELPLDDPAQKRPATSFHQAAARY